MINTPQSELVVAASVVSAFAHANLEKDDAVEVPSFSIVLLRAALDGVGMDWRKTHDDCKEPVNEWHRANGRAWLRVEVFRIAMVFSAAFGMGVAFCWAGWL